MHLVVVEVVEAVEVHSVPEVVIVGHLEEEVTAGAHSEDQVEEVEEVDLVVEEVDGVDLEGNDGFYLGFVIYNTSLYLQHNK